jgi:hypothetical protein
MASAELCVAPDSDVDWLDGARCKSCPSALALAAVLQDEISIYQALLHSPLETQG